MQIVYSINDVPIRLTEERWEHIISNKPYMDSYDELVLKAIERPTWILQGYAGSLIAILALANQNYLHVVYKEISADDGFIITTFMAHKFNRRMILWSQQNY